jgi:hypothetical protein
MIGKIRQWVPIERTRWRNEGVNEEENQAVGSPYGVAPGGDMAPLPHISKYCCILRFERVPSW